MRQGLRLQMRSLHGGRKGKTARATYRPCRLLWAWELAIRSRLRAMLPSAQLMSPGSCTTACVTCSGMAVVGMVGGVREVV